MSTFKGWGRHIPKEMTGKIAVTWGARAIYTNQHIDLLPDRQSWHVTGYSEDDADQTSVCYEERRARMRPLMNWINSKGLPFLRKESKQLYTDDTRVVTLNDGVFHIEASPQASYGYLYVRAWEATTDAHA
jgi:hypothetical protein